MDEYSIAGKDFRRHHETQRTALNPDASVDVVGDVTLGSQAGITHPAYEEIGVSVANSQCPRSQPPRYPSPEGAAGANHVLDACEAGVPLDGMCPRTDLPSGPLNVLLPPSHSASHPRVVVQQQAVNASDHASTAVSVDLPVRHRRASQGYNVSETRRDSPVDFAFLDAPSMLSIPGGSPCDEPWSPHAVALDDPLMYPLPCIEGNSPTSLPQNESLSVPSSGWSPSHSPHPFARQLGDTSGNFLPADSCTARQSGAGCDLTYPSDCLTVPAHNESFAHAVCKSTEQSAHLSHVSGRSMFPNYMHNTIPPPRYGLQRHSHSCAIREHIREQSPESMRRPQLSLQNAPGNIGGTSAVGGIVGSTGLSLSAPPRALAAPFGSDTLHAKYRGLNSMHGHHAASMFD